MKCILKRYEKKQSLNNGKIVSACVAELCQLHIKKSNVDGKIIQLSYMFGYLVR